jgi:glycosyltransferase involved in cell wall biosynthesis
LIQLALRASSPLIPQAALPIIGEQPMSSTMVLPVREEQPSRPDRIQCSTGTVRVLHVINGEFYSGAERVQDLLALRLPEHGFEVGFACLKPGRFLSARRSREAAVHTVRMRFRLDPLPIIMIARLAKLHNYKLIHAHTPRAALVGRAAAKIAGVPFVYHVHSPAAADSTRSLQNRLNAFSERISLQRGATLVAVSEDLGQRMRASGFSQQPLAVVHNGVPGQASLTERTLPWGTWTLGTVALFRPRKGTEVLLEALALLNSQRVPVRLRAIGAFETPEYEVQLKARAVELGVNKLIDWAGFRADVDAELRRIDLFVLPSLFGEGLPMVVLESMAVGTPVIATRVGGVPEAIRHGQDGLLAEPADAHGLAEMVAEVIRGKIDWQALRASAFARQSHQFSDRSMAAGVAKVYRQVLEG